MSRRVPRTRHFYLPQTRQFHFAATRIRRELRILSTLRGLEQGGHNGYPPEDRL